MLAAEAQLLRGKLEVTKFEDSRRLAALEQHGKEAESKTRDRLAAQERQLDELMADRSRVCERLDALETAAAGIADQLLENQQKVAELHGEMEKQAGEFEASLSHTTELLDTMDSRLGELAEQGRLYQQLGQETQTELRDQGVRLGWTTMAAAMAIVLATVSGAILVWEAQKNAKLLASMNDDMEQLLAGMKYHLDSLHQGMGGTTPPAAGVGGKSTGNETIPAMHSPGVPPRAEVPMGNRHESHRNAVIQSYLPAVRKAQSVH